MEEILPEKVDEMVAYYLSHNHSVHNSYIKPFPNIIETLELLKKAGITMGVVTSKRREGAIRALNAFDMPHYFSIIVAGDDVDRYKPDPYPITKALEDLAVSPEQVLMVGDTPMDILCACNAGVKSVLVGWTYLKESDFAGCTPDYIIKEFPQLLDIVGICGNPVPS